MKRWKLVVVCIVAFIFGALQLSSANSGAAPLGNTNAPGEQNCAQCHNSFGLNQGPGRIVFNGIPDGYELGKTYNIEIRIDDPDAIKWGFQLTIIDGIGQSAGAIGVNDGINTGARNAAVNGLNRDYLVPTTAGNFSNVRNTASWRFIWTAPERDMGPVTFYVAGVAADRDGTTMGDRVYATSSTISLFSLLQPRITFIDPPFGPTAGRNRVLLLGENFRPGLRVTFDGIDGQAEFVDANRAAATVPPHVAGNVDVRVINSDGQGSTFVRGYRYDNPPLGRPPFLRGLTPSLGRSTGGMRVTLMGEDFQIGARVVWDGVELETTFINDKNLMITTPVHQVGRIDISVINPDGQSSELKNGFTYQLPASIELSLLMPLGGEVLSAGGEPVTITWEVEANGDARQRLLLSTDGGATFPVLIASNLRTTTNRFTWSVPEDITSDRAILRLEAVLDDFTANDLTKELRVVRAPVIKGLSPATTRTAATGINLEIRGTGFEKGAVVEMDGQPIKAKVVNSTLIKVKRAPRLALGSHFVSVRNPNGGLSRGYLFTVAQ